MQKCYKIIRAVLATLVALPPVLAVVFYILLSLPSSQNALRRLAQNKLTELLGSELTIGNVDIFPFERISVSDVELQDDFGRTAAFLADISAGIDIERLLFSRKIVVDFVEIDGFEAHLYRTSPDGELNIAGMIERLMPHNPRKEETRFALKVNTLVIDDARFSYDVWGTDSVDDGRFDPNHIEICDLNLAANIPSLATELYDVNLFSFNFTERCGFRLDNLSVNVHFSPDLISVSDFQLQLPASFISLEELALTPDALKRLPRIESATPLRIALAEGSYVTPSDLVYFVPALACADSPVELSFGATVDGETIQIDQLSLHDITGFLDFSLYGTVERYYQPDNMTVDIPTFHLNADFPSMLRMMRICNPGLALKVAKMAEVGKFDLSGHLEGTPSDIGLDAMMSSAVGDLRIVGNVNTGASYRMPVISAKVNISDFNAEMFVPSSGLGNITGTVESKLRFGSRYPKGEIKLDIESLTYRGYTYSDVAAKVWTEGSQVRAEVDIDDENAFLSAEGFVDLSPDFFDLFLQAQLSRFRPDKLNLWDTHPGYELSGNLDVAFVGDKPEDADGHIRLFDIEYYDREGRGVNLNEFRIDAASAERPKHIDLRSDFINGRLTGMYTTSALVPMAKNIVYHFLPVLTDTATVATLDRLGLDSLAVNDFEYELRIDTCSRYSKFFNLPIAVISPIQMQGEFSGQKGEILFETDTDWILINNKVISDNKARIHIDVEADSAAVYATTSFDTKKGPMAIVLESDARNNMVNNVIDWEIQRENKIFGTVDVTTTLFRDYAGLGAKAHFNPGSITFGNVIWEILPSDIIYSAGAVEVRNFSLMADDESLRINGRVSKDPADELVVDLNSVELIDIFETLEIDKALIGGRATGSVTGSSLLSGMPIATAESLSVKNISYNYCPLGDAEVKASWDQERMAFGLSADVAQHNGLTTRIFGDIYAGRDSLDINFEANEVNIGFLRPFMSAFASDVGGRASGQAHLFGTFKDVDLEGKLFADSLTIRLDYTNTAYTVLRDSVHIRPGVIDIPPVTLYDMYGHTAKFTGWLRHDFFHDPSFNFEVYDANNLLCYDVTPRMNERWYGHIFGNSQSRRTSITGIPGKNGARGEVSVNVQMTTAGRSNFTFALLDREVAGVYDFLSFRDVTVREIDSLIDIDTTPELVREMQRRKNMQQDDESSKVMFNLSAEITPGTKMTLIMDPVSGDSIVATGSGRIDMSYNSVNDDITMKGSYTIERGHYDVSVQDIIHKNFVINSGSKVTFNGDPYNAILDISAKYVTQASLSDLDESFNLDGKGSQSVPVHAIVMVKGSIASPVISFDLEYPTLKEETRRKVNSIINTPEILQRQVAYLISMGRFYTPDYMSGTRGNELVSVASATLSSQISSMLGQLSDKWRIAPSVRSDRGDFSDVEVDVSLSSYLLNNRLIFNGNFGYRDKSLNTNQFVGDFDIEYLLNPRGSWRLKAYNRYNDQNYYLRSAATTQGVGIVYQKDFDNLFSFLRKKRTIKPVKPEQKPDSVNLTNGRAE